MGEYFIPFFFHGTQLHRGSIECLNWVGKNCFLAFPWCPLLYKIKVIIKVNALQMPNKLNFTNTIETFNDTPVKLSSVAEKRHKTPTQPKWILSELGPMSWKSSIFLSVKLPLPMYFLYVQSGLIKDAVIYENYSHWHDNSKNVWPISVAHMILGLSLFLESLSNYC